jgi:hypothetical protein
MEHFKALGLENRGIIDDKLKESALMRHVKNAASVDLEVMKMLYNGTKEELLDGEGISLF